MISTGCNGNSNADGADQQTNQKTNSDTTSDAVLKVSEGIVCIDQSQFTGDELELIKLVNLSVEYRNKGDEKSYFALFNSNVDPNRKLPLQKIVQMRLESIKVFNEDSAMIVAYAITESDGEFARTYTFTMENSKWKIADID
jgi:hypothetical protein